MKSRVFRSLIRSLLAASLPLVCAQTGCGTCYDSSTNDVAPGAMVKVRLQPQSCASFCGAPVSSCSAVVNGQTSFAVECPSGPAQLGTDTTIWANVLLEDCGTICSGGVDSCVISRSFDPGTPRNITQCNTSHTCVKGPSTVVEGRRPAELALGEISGESDVGAFFAEVMQLEAASIDAFAILAAELAEHGAPADLVAAAERAGRDEVRHARMAETLMRRFGGAAERPVVPRRPVRPLREVALENAVEGCVREAYGAFVASWQASAARDEAIRAVMRRVAADEIEHAELSFAVAAWAEPLLSPAEREEVRAARAEAVAALQEELAAEPSPALREIAGLPPAAASLAFVRAHAALPEPPRA